MAGGHTFHHLEVTGAGLEAAFLALTGAARAADAPTPKPTGDPPVLASLARPFPSASPFLAYLRLEVRRTLRNRRYLVFTIVFPVLLYVLYTAVLPQAGGSGSVDGLTWPVYFLVSMAAYGAIGAAMSQAAPIAMERRQGWARQLRVTPLPGPAYVAAKVVSALALTVPALILVSAAGRFVNHVDLPLATWAILVADPGPRRHPVRGPRAAPRLCA